MNCKTMLNQDANTAKTLVLAALIVQTVFFIIGLLVLLVAFAFTVATVTTSVGNSL